MYKKILLGIIFTSQLFTAEQQKEFNLITLDKIPWAESRESSEVNNDSFCISVISFIAEHDKDILDVDLKEKE